MGAGGKGEPLLNPSDDSSSGGFLIHGIALVCYSAAISACEKGGQWQQALSLLSEKLESKLEPDIISYSAGITACEKGGAWHLALSLLIGMRESKLDPDVATYSDAISACEEGGQWLHSLSLLSDMWSRRWNV